MKKKIYFAGSIRGGRVDAALYQRMESDMVIAECTCPSLGVGYELAYAEAHGIPVYIFYDKNKSNLSAMLNGNAYFTILPYETEEDIFCELDRILKKG